jgi:FdhD protein
MRPAQRRFTVTGGVHAAALFDAAGNVLAVREDVGRHNAVDKLIGHFLLAGRVPLARTILCVSGRAGFEIVQKAAIASVPVLVSVGAATSLALEVAEQAGMELYSFAGGGSANRHLPSLRPGGARSI